MQTRHWRLLFGVGLVGSVILGFLGDSAPVYIWDFAVFFAIFGLLGCLLLSYLAKGLVSPVLDRPEAFYSEIDAEGDWSTQTPAARRTEATGHPPSSPGEG